MNDRINDNLENPEDITGEMQFGEILRDVGLISSERLQELLEAAKNSEESLGGPAPERSQCRKPESASSI